VLAINSLLKLQAMDVGQEKLFFAIYKLWAVTQFANGQTSTGKGFFRNPNNEKKFVR